MLCESDDGAYFTCEEDFYFECVDSNTVEVESNCPVSFQHNGEPPSSAGSAIFYNLAKKEQHEIDLKSQFSDFFDLDARKNISSNVLDDFCKQLTDLEDTLSNILNIIDEQLDEAKCKHLFYPKLGAIEDEHSLIHDNSNEQVAGDGTKMSDSFESIDKASSVLTYYREDL